jgi:hypothetical protein
MATFDIGNPSAVAASGTNQSGTSAIPQRIEHGLRWAFGTALLLRLLFPIFESPLNHLFSDPLRHWQNGLYFRHPNVMGGGDPYLYQLWLYLLQQIDTPSHAAVLVGSGLLCALMPFGWYRALKEILPRHWALAGGILMALVPGFLGVYAYFMNETLLLTLTGFAFWFTFRAQRKRSVGAFAAACALWLAAGFTRSVALPLALACMLTLWFLQPRKFAKALVAGVLLLVFAVPAGLHGRAGLGYFAPFGNLYLNQIYKESGRRIITIDCGPQGRYEFGSPSFYHPTFYPFSGWTTDRSGVAAIAVDVARGRDAWIAERERVRRERTFPQWRDFLENFLYLSFGQPWPDNGLHSMVGSLAVWTRWIWFPLFLAVAWGTARGRFRGREWLLPACALGMFVYLSVQHEGVMEARFRKPIDPIVLAAAIVMCRRVMHERTAGLQLAT